MEGSTLKWTADVAYDCTTEVRGSGIRVLDGFSWLVGVRAVGFGGSRNGVGIVWI